MCCCERPTVNGEFGYKWQRNDSPMVYKPYAPELREGENLLFDEPGRCGGVDSHSYHYRLVTWHSSFHLLVRHSGGEESLRLSAIKTLVEALGKLDLSRPGI